MAVLIQHLRYGMAIQLKLNYSNEDYQRTYKQDARSKTPCASDFKQVLLDTLAEDIIDTVDGKSIEYIRKKPSPSKSRGRKGKSCSYDKSSLTIDGMVYKLSTLEANRLDFICKVIKHWLQPEEYILETDQPSTVSKLPFWFGSVVPHWKILLTLHLFFPCRTKLLT